MFEYLKGILVEVSLSTAIVDVNNLAYKLLIPLSTYNKLPRVGELVKLYLTHVVREDSQRLYAFYSLEERDFFEKLLDISGIGPKTALALIGHINIEETYAAIHKNDINVLCRVPGVGKKTAERLVVEMKDKLKNFCNLDKINTSSIHLDAVSALVNLGYNNEKADKAVRKALLEIDKDSPLPTIITLALQRIHS